ncbi:MAG: TrkA family potassium uptake protein, partial [Anaerolineales bacterium]|nr:TrkA family potassium uptake protein [Anaerolineales bacterium]
MAKRRSFLVIGLGRFGTSLAEALVQKGHEVMGVDADPVVVQRLSTHLTHTVVMEAVTEETLLTLGIGNFDAVIVATGGNFESSILLTLMLKRLGARYVVANAHTEQQADVLNQVGADKVVQPEQDAGRRIAHQLITPNILDYLPLAAGMSVAEVPAPEFMVGKTLAELEMRRKYRISVLLIENG